MDTFSIGLLLGSFFLLILIGVPIAYAMIISSVITMYHLNLSLITVANTLVSGVSGFTFLAIPFFVLAGDLMANGGISDRLVRLANALVGWMRGGLAMVNIVASTMFGAISGSATADTASIGPILIPMMKKQGYDGEFATAITMTSSVQGLLIPPSHNFVIFAMAAGGVSIGGLFMAGIIPGLLLALTLMVYSYVVSVKRKYPHGEKFSLKTLLRETWSGILGLFTVVIIVVGVIGGFFTATEAAAIAVVYAFCITFFVYRDVPLKAFWGILKGSLKTLSMVLLLIAAAGTFGFLITFLRIPQFLTQEILALTESRVIILLLINVLLLVLGMIMGMASIIVIMTPILLPIVTQFGIHPIQFGVIIILNCGIGLLTPPVGGVLFVGSGVSGIKIEHLLKETLPIIAVMVLLLLVVTFVPSVSLFLPRALGLIA